MGQWTAGRPAGASQAAGRFGEDWQRAVEELELLAMTGADHDPA